jgi:hypothetical protein
MFDQLPLAAPHLPAATNAVQARPIALLAGEFNTASVVTFTISAHAGSIWRFVHLLKPISRLEQQTHPVSVRELGTVQPEMEHCRWGEISGGNTRTSTSVQSSLVRTLIIDTLQDIDFSLGATS